MTISFNRNIPLLIIKKEKLSNQTEGIINNVEQNKQVVENEQMEVNELVATNNATENLFSKEEEVLVADPKSALENCSKIDEMRVQILLTEKSAMEAIWLTAQINKIIAVRKLKHLLKENDNDNDNNNDNENDKDEE